MTPQWISTQAKDGINSIGVGSAFNVLNTGQMLVWHVMLLPLVVGFLVVAHIVLVRRHSVVPPFDATPTTDLPAHTVQDTGATVPTAAGVPDPVLQPSLVVVRSQSCPR